MSEQHRAWMADIQQGSQQAFAALMAAFAERVYNTCLGFLPNRHDAEDVAQEVFVELFRSAGQYRGEAAVGTWIYRIAVRKSLEALRYRQRQRRSPFFRALFGPDALEQASQQHSAPAAAMEQQELAALLDRCVAALPEQQRAAFVLRQVEGLSQREIAAVLDLSEKAVESLLVRARRKLREGLQHYERH